MVNKINKGVRLLFVVSFLGAIVCKSHAQNLIVANPAEDTDFKSMFVNPAILSFQDRYVAVGGKLFHLGFVQNQTSPFRQGFVSLSLPFGISNKMGLGIQGQYFNTPLFSQSNLSFLLSRRIKRNVAVGLKFNVFSKSFNQANFDLVDANDPVFRNGTSKWAATFGAGLFMYPLSNLSIGIGIDHINRANISLTNDNVYQPFKSYFGAVWQYGLIRVSMSASYEDGRWLPKTSIGTGMTNVGYFMVGYNERSFQAEAQYRITGPLSLNYSYEYTIFDHESFGQGSHQVTLIHNFGQKRELPKFEIPRQMLLKFQPPDKSYLGETKFYVFPTVEKLDIIEKKLTRKIDPNLDAKALAQLSEFDVGALDGRFEEQVLPFEKRSVDVGRIPAVEEANLSKKYKAFLKAVAKKSKGDRATQTNIITPRDSYLRAAGLKKYFLNDTLTADNVRFIEPIYQNKTDSLVAMQKIGNQFILPHEELQSLSSASTTFQITPVSQMIEPKTWNLIVQNSNNMTVKSFAGKGMPDAKIEWDWRDESGKLITPGVYSYVLEWQDKQGAYHQTEEKFISVQKLIRHINIEITHKQKSIGDHADEIDIILKH